MEDIETHPVQRTHYLDRESGRCPKAVTLRAYEVYCALYGPQEALITGWCRGGFAVGELIQYLYARSFPKEEWRKRVDEATEGMAHL